MFWVDDPNGNSCSISRKPSLIPVSGLRGRFSANGERDSGKKFTSPEFCLPFAETLNQPDYPCKCSATIVNDFFLFRYQTVVDESIAVVIKKRQVKSQVRGLTEHDLFFREVNKSD